MAFSWRESGVENWGLGCEAGFSVRGLGLGFGVAAARVRAYF